MTAGKYPNITRTPTFIAAFADVRSYLRRTSPMAYIALPSALETILEVIDGHPKAWPNKQRRIIGKEVEFHLAIVSIAYRRLHVRYVIGDEEPVLCRLVAVWVDGRDEPDYQID